MAPTKPFRTYGRGNNSVNCVEAFDILFAKNLTQRKLDKKVHKGKNKLKIEIKELPTKIKTVLKDESSLRVNINDTFDKLLKQPSKGVGSQAARVKLIANKSSFSVINNFSSFNDTRPMVHKLRSYTRSRSNKSTTKNSLDSWFNQPTPPGAGITNMLEIEEVDKQKKANVSKKASKKSVHSESNWNSPMALRSRSKITVEKSAIVQSPIALDDLSKQTKADKSIKHTIVSNQNSILNPFFTNSVREQILIHSSTPVAPTMKKRLVAQPVSPIKNRDEVTNCIVESLEEIRSWDSSLPEIQLSESEIANSTNTSKNSQKEHLQTLSFDLEHFELFFEQLKAQTSKKEKLEPSNSNFKVRSFTLDDFEKFHKKLIGNQNSQGHVIKSISLKDFESFCESYQSKVSIDKDSFFDYCRNTPNFVTHRKQKFSLKPNLHPRTRLSKKFNLKNLVVLLDNNLINISKPKTPGYSLMSSICKKQLTVKLTRFSLDQLKSVLRPKQSLPKAKSRRTSNRFKACRKFSSNLSMPQDSCLLPRNTNISNMELKTPCTVCNSSNTTEISKRYSNIEKTVNFGIGDESDHKSEKENEICSRYSRRSKKNRNSSFINSFRFSSPRRKSSNGSSRKESSTNMRYLRTSRFENVDQTSSQEVSEEGEMGELFSHSHLSETASTPKPQSGVQKQYIAKILLASSSDSSFEVQDQQNSSMIISEYSSNISLLNSTNHISRSRSCHSYSNMKDQNTPLSSNQKEFKSARIYSSNSDISYIAQDLSNTILINIQTSPTTDANSAPRLSTKLADRRTVSPTSMCLRSSRKNTPNNGSYQAESCHESQTGNESVESVGPLEFSIIRSSRKNTPNNGSYQAESCHKSQTGNESVESVGPLEFSIVRSSRKNTPNNGSYQTERCHESKTGNESVESVGPLKFSIVRSSRKNTPNNGSYQAESCHKSKTRNESVESVGPLEFSIVRSSRKNTPNNGSYQAESCHKSKTRNESVESVGPLEFSIVRSSRKNTPNNGSYQAESCHKSKTRNESVESVGPLEFSVVRSSRKNTPNNGSYQAESCHKSKTGNESVESVGPLEFSIVRSSRKNTPNNGSYQTEKCHESKTGNESVECVELLDFSIESHDSEKLDQLEDSVFIVPNAIGLTQKPPNLKAGKSWRRSLMQHKRDMFVDLTRESYCGNISNHLKLIESPRLSAKILPANESRCLRRKTLLQTYVYSGASPGVDITNGVRPSISGEGSLAKLDPLITTRDIVLQYCKQTEPVDFDKIYPKSLLKNCKKIGEGVYGEVFLYSQANGRATVMKIIPIEGDKIVNGEKQKKFHEILSEVIIVSELSNLRNNVHNNTLAFCEVQRISCVRGKYPKVLLDLWHEYDQAKGSENDPPGVFESDQLYIVLDLADAGQDLEAFVFTNASQSVTMFKQMAYALAVSEEHLKFEHRDLHWGNVLLRKVDRYKKAVFKHKGKVKECPTQGVEVTIIDFTLSRIEHDGVVIFNDLGQDPDLFLAEGDYQFDIYRLMQQRNNNDWQKFTPYSNILWLHYILKKSITALRYKNTKTKTHKKCIESLKKYENDILNFNCVSEFVDECL